MEPVRIGLMGFGRIGRNIFRILYKSDDLRIQAISDLASDDALAYLLRFDTVLGRFPDELSARDGQLYVYGRQIPLVKTKQPGEIPWGDLGVDVVVEATARNRTRADLEKHLEMGAKRVILCSPPAEEPDFTAIAGINDHRLKAEHKIVSNASSTAHCIAPVLQLLDEAFGIERAFLNSVHAYTNQQRLADVPAEDMRRGRAAAENIIPQATNAASLLMKLFPHLASKISGMAMNVPIPDGSVVDLVCWHKKPVTTEAINEVVRTGASARWPGILGYEDQPVVSSDIVHTSYSGIFDSLATEVLGNKMSKTLSWYDNGWGYAHRAVELIRHFSKLDQAELDQEAA